METAVYSPRDAKVAAVDVAAGSTVAAGDLLVVLEGSDTGPELWKGEKAEQKEAAKK